MREACLQDWMDREAIAESMIPLIGTLYRKKNVVTSVYGRPVVNRSVIDILNEHRYVRHMQKQELSHNVTNPILTALSNMEVGRAHIDLGKLAVKSRNEANGQNLEAFLQAELSEVVGKTHADGENRDVVLY